MAAYFVVYQNVTDLQQYGEYFKAVVPLIDQCGGRLIAQGSPEAMEGEMPWQRIVVLEWRSRQEFLHFWQSDEYAEIKQLRQGAAEWQAAIVESV